MVCEDYPRQTNHYDCGVFMLCGIKDVVRSYFDWSFNRTECKYKRFLICLEVMQERLFGFWSYIWYNILNIVNQRIISLLAGLYPLLPTPILCSPPLSSRLLSPPSEYLQILPSPPIPALSASTLPSTPQFPTPTTHIPASNPTEVEKEQ